MKILDIEYVRKIAKENGYKFLSDVYINSTTKYTWECKNGHIFETTYHGLMLGERKEKGLQGICIKCKKIPFNLISCQNIK